jgi:hypothetical protein
MRRYAALLSILPVFAAGQAVTLKRTPKVGEVYKYRVTLVFTIYGNDVFYTSTVTDKVTEVAKDGSYTVASTQSEVSASAGQDLPVEKNEKPSYTVYDAKGHVLDLKGEQAAASWRDAYLSAFVLPDKPVAKGDTWSATLPPKADLKTPGASINYTSLGMDTVPIAGIQVLRVDEKFAENSQSDRATSTGTIWVDPRDGSVVKMEEVWRNAPILGVSTLVNGNISYERVQ